MELVARYATAAGQVAEKPFAAESAEALRQDLESKGFFVFRIRQKALGLPALTKGAVNETDFITFNQELVALVHAGLPLLQCIELLSQRRQDPRFRDTLLDIRDKVKAGSSLSDAFASHGAFFPSVYAPNVSAGEKSGNLEDVLRRYVSYAQVMGNVRRKVRAALVYPAVLIALSCVLVGILVSYVIPRFASFYKDFEATLPLITRTLIALSTFAQGNAWLLALAAFGLFALYRFASVLPAVKLVRDRFILDIPVAGEVLRKYNVSQFARTLSTLLSGGLPLVPSLQIASGAVGNARVADRIGSVADQIREGAALADSLDKTGLWSDTTLSMVRVGESAGALTEMLQNVADFYDAEVDRRVQTFVTLLEPALLVIMGTVIAGMLLAMYYPLFTLIQVVR